MSRLILLLLASAGLAGCSAQPYLSSGFVASMPLGASAGPPQGRPLALLPAGAGPVLAVHETAKPNAVLQTIVLGGSQTNSGENRITVTALVPQDPRLGNVTEGLATIAKPTDVAIQQELETEFPAVPMNISLAYDRTAQGPFGYATGRARDGSTCLYAFQNLGSDQPLSLFEGVAGREQSPMSIRVRLCKRRASEAELASLVRAMVVYSPGNATAVAAPLPSTDLPAGDALAAARATGPVFPGGASTLFGAPTYPAPITPSASPGDALGFPQTAASAIDTAEPAVRRAHPRIVHRLARRSRPVHRSVVRREQPGRIVGAAIPLPSEITTPGAPVRPNATQPGAAAAAPSVAAMDSVPLPH